jgi:hypothetical protein
LAIAVAAWAARAGDGASPQTAPGGDDKTVQFRIESDVYQGDPLGTLADGTLKRLATPQLVTAAGRPATFFTGGQAVVGGECVPFGYQFTATPESADGGNVRLKLELTFTEVLDRTSDGARIRTD